LFTPSATEREINAVITDIEIYSWED